MAGFDYSQAHGKGGYFISPDETELQPLDSPYSPEEYRGHRGRGSLTAPLVDASRSLFGGRFQGLQTQMTMIEEKEMIGLESYHSRKKQLYRLMGRMLGRFLTSLVFCGGIVGLFVYYQRRGVLNSNEKHLFNAIFIGLSMLLSMNLLSAFKSLAGMMRWRILANNEHTLREVDLILSLSSFQKTLELLWISTTKLNPDKNLTKKQRTAATKRWSFRLGAAGWILLGLGAQIDVALIGLTYNHESEGAVGQRPGPVKVINLSSIAEYDYTYLNFTPTATEQKYAAHLYGVVSTNSDITDIDEMTEATQIPNNATIVRDLSTNAFYYNFREWPTCGDCEYPAVRTNRSIEILPRCRWYDIPEGQYGNSASPITIVSEEGNATIDWLEGSEPGMTIMANPEWRWDDVILSPEYTSCGQRCSYIYIFHFFPGSNGTFFNCTVEIGEVSNATHDHHMVSDGAAAIIAGAAGSEGWKDGLGRQLVKYDQSTYWGGDNGVGINGEYIAEETLGKFSCGVFAAYDQFGVAKVEAQGTQAWVGVRLTVKWIELYISLGMILAIQLLFGIFIVFKANSVYCKDDSFLSTGRLLRPLLERLGPSGSHCDGKKIAATFPRKVVYGVRTGVNQGIHHLDFGEDIDVLSHGQSFPEGKYD